MKISKISAYLPILYTPERKQDKPQNKIDYKQINLSSYPKEYYLSFQGGKSLNLKQTLEQLQKHNAKFPPGIEKMAEDEISTGNSENKRLVDIHRQKYRELKDCDTLDEIKFFFPEFENVLSVEEDNVSFQKGSLIDKFMNGEIRTKDGNLLLNPNKDLSVQLIQMYWGDCLSFPDIGNECGHNFSNTFKKLNIPTVSSIYGHYLKLSDEEANKAIIAATQRNRSVPEHIIRKKGIPLSPQHRQNISKGLEKYHREHPNIDFEHSEEDKQYF